MVRRCLLLPLALVVFASVTGSAQAPRQPAPLAKPQPAAPATPATAAGLQDRAELEAFLDGVVAAQKKSNHVEGLTIAVVRDGGLFFAKGYGLADRAGGKKVDPERTLFRVGSVSKLFTWTAVMQLVEQGKLDLRADVNQYLAGSPVHVPETYPQPVTMTNLLTHTPGFEDPVVGLFAKSAESMRPLGQILAVEMPDRVRPPGLLSSYSNHGTALAGYIVERVSGMPYADYVEKRILAPLEMSHTAVRQPLPKTLEGDMSVGYKWADGEHQAQTFEYVPAAPAGAVSASAVDMTHFMLAHLQDGRYGEARILSEATAREMHGRLFGHVPALSGMLHGFYEMNRNGHRIYGHGGDTLWFHTELALFPDDAVGLFVSCNSDSCAPARSALVEAFIDRYFPAAGTSSAPRRTRQTAPGALAGSYRSIRMSYRSLAKVAALVGTISVSELPDGRVRTDGLGASARRWVEVAPLVFRDTESEDRIAFLKGPDGRVTHMVADFPAIAFERLGPLELPVLHYSVGGVSLFLLLAAVIAWPITGWREWRRRRAMTGEAAAEVARRPVSPPRAARLVLWIAASLLIAFTVLFGIVMTDPMDIVFGIPRLLRVALALPLVATVLTLASLAFAALSWRHRYWGWAGRMYYSLVALSAAALIVDLWYWNLLGYHLQ